MKNRASVVAGVAVLLCVLVAQLYLSVRQETQTWDETDHIYAAYMMWKRADYGLNPEHPPLVKLVAAVPLLGMPLRTPPTQDRFFKNEAFLNGRQFLYGNAPVSADQILIRVRMAAAVFTVLLALLTFLCAQEMFGTIAGFIALFLLILEPNILAHGALVTTDVGLSCFMLATIYAFYRYVKRPTMARVVVLGIAAGLALAAKHTGVLVVPMLILLALYEAFRHREARNRQVQRLAIALVAAFAIAIAVLWPLYAFRYSERPAGLPMNPPFSEYVKQLRPHEAALVKAAAATHLIPRSWIYGLSDVRVVADTTPSYIFGKVYAHGVWFYFPAAFVIKSTLPVLVLLAITLWAIAAGRFRREREIVFLVLPAAFYMLVAMTSGLNIGARHILPLWVFSAVLVSGAAVALMFGKLGSRNRTS
ncbi:MAG TPA: glycosyltransferase family 39 protein, partial [Terriglobales bacterium]